MESYQEKDKIGPWSDLYAVCAVWYEAVTGHKVPAAPQRVKRDHIRVPSDFVKVPDQMEQAFMRGLSVDIQSRYFSIVNLLHQLDLQEETDDEEESAAIRKIWGDSWIRITDRGGAGFCKEPKKRKISQPSEEDSLLMCGFDSYGSPGEGRNSMVSNDSPGKSSRGRPEK